MKRRYPQRTSVRRDERGGGSGLTLAVIVICLVASFVMTVLASWIACVHRARNAADLAALSGAHTFIENKDVCAQARVRAEANGGRMVACDVASNSAGEFSVEVRVHVELWPRIPGGPKAVAESAKAGVINR